MEAALTGHFDYGKVNVKYESDISENVVGDC